MQQFVINKNATLPYLEMEVIQDGRHDFKKIYYALQASSVTFSMTNVESGVKKIVNEPCLVVSVNDSSCEDRLKLQYRWKKRDTKESGRYIGQFKINFDKEITSEAMNFPKGELIVPIGEELEILINDGSIKV